MTHKTSDTLQDFDPKKYFTKARRQYIDEPLKALGFKQYKSSVVARITSGNIFQFLDFQKSAYGGQNFTVNVAIRPLFSRNDEYLTLLPGNRLGLMATKSKSDKWWNYTTELEGNENFADLFDKISKYAIPFFELTQNSKDIIAAYEKNFLGINKFGDRVAWGTVGWEDFDLGHIYLHAGQIKKAFKHFNACYKEFIRDDRDWAQEAAKKCLEIQNIIELGKLQIDDYLADTINYSKEKLKLTDW
ncbi:DUF4304 domain-containing protein [Limnovirga soli]|uniref:DUF4304 domain-containing protein n=1 Tax=Limnovirga soli TaxID=2656915 RepID=A0A8J8FGY2_9BACT|nr:DUF4304 domain-containing protein [Limnovirga soli]NNV57222.1 DUF4304 domain-containing protein [Limnovirga soli]